MEQWQSKLITESAKLSIEIIAVPSGLAIISPKDISPENRAMLLSIIPEDIRGLVEFTVGPRTSTIKAFSEMLTSVKLKLNGVPEMVKNLTIDMISTPETKEVNWDKASDIFKKDSFFDSWKLSVDGNVVVNYNRKAIEIMAKNHFREVCIQQEEITNLRILLGSESDFDKILARL